MKTRKWIILLIAAILTVILAITVVGCKPEDTNPDPNNQQDLPKNVTALKANLLEMSGFSEEITVEGANYDFRDQAISLSMINNFCTNISLSAMSQAKIDALATKDFDAMEGPQDLLTLDLTEDDFVILATALYAAGVTTYNNPALFDAAELAAQAYVALVPAETKEIFEDYAEIFAVVEQLSRGYNLDNETTQADIDAGVALLATIGLEGNDDVLSDPEKTLRYKLQEGVIYVAVQALEDAEDAINALEDPIRSAAQQKQGSRAINENSYDFGTFANWARLISENEQTTDESTLVWLATWLDGVKEIDPDTTITIPATTEGFTVEWINSVEDELHRIHEELQRVSNDYVDYARIAFQAQGMAVLPEESFLFNATLQPKLQALMPELPVFAYRAINVMFGDELMGLISSEFDSLGELEGSDLAAIIDSLKTNLTELSAFATANESDLLLLKAALNTLAENSDFRFIRQQLLVGSEAIDAIVNTVPYAEDIIQKLAAPLNSTNITGFFDALDPEADVQTQMNSGIYFARIAEGMLAEYAAPSDFADALCALIFDHSSDHLYFEMLNSVQSAFAKMLPGESEAITEGMMANFEYYVDLKETMLQLEATIVPEMIEEYYDYLQTNLDGAVGTTITDFSNADQVSTYILAVNVHLDSIVDDAVDGVRITMDTLITEALTGTVYATLDPEIIGALADCTPVTDKEDYSEDADYAALAEAMTDFINIFIGMGMFDEGEYDEMPLIGEEGGRAVEELFASFMEGLMEGMMGEDVDYEDMEPVLLTSLDPFEFIGDEENAQWFKLEPNVTGETQISVTIENSAWWGDFEFLHPNGEEFNNWYGGDIYLNVYAGMTYYISFCADDAGTLSMSAISPTSYSVLPD